jgi:uncharacterized membrane protein YgcG
MSTRAPFHPGDEERIAAEMARELERMLDARSTPAVAASDGFSDRVMAAIAGEPLPQPVRAFGFALQSGRAGAAAAAVVDAWRVVTGSFAPAFVRAQALALVLVVVVASLALAGGVAAGAAAWLAGQSSPTPSVVLPSSSPPPSPSPSPSVAPTASPEPSASADPSHQAEPTETATPTDDHGGAGATQRPRTPEPTSDHGGGSGSDSGSGGSGSGSGSGGSPTETPSVTDDHGGSDG